MENTDRLPDPALWSALHTRMDRAIGDAATGYLQDLRHRGIPFDPLGWTRELDLLTHGRNVDYNRPGLPLMYAIRYMPKRVISLITALAWVSRNRGEPATVLDVGSGTGAVIVAHQLINPNSLAQLVGLDASSEMTAFARQTQAGKRAQTQFIDGTIVDLISSPKQVEPFDMVTFSAPFDRDFSDWDPLTAALDHPLHRARSVLAVEPESRGFLLERFADAFERRGWTTAWSSSNDVPEFMKVDRTLNALTRVWRHLGSPGSYRPQTWWEPPADRYLLAHQPL